MQVSQKTFSHKKIQQVADLHQGDCIQLIHDHDQFQIIGIDRDHNKCWVRRWPLLPNGSPVFEISIQQIALPCQKSKQ